MHIRRGDGRMLVALMAAATVTFEENIAVCAQLIDISEEERLRKLQPFDSVAKQ